MRAMASRLLSSLKTHPFIIASSVLLLFALPVFRVLVFFWPLIVSTVLGVLAVVSFGRTADEHGAKPLHAPESALQADSAAAFSSHEGKLGNVLMVGNREVTWLEWLHNEDTQKLCIHEREPAVWDVDAGGYDSITMPSEAMSNVVPSSRASTDASAGKHDVLDDAPLPVTAEGIVPYVCGSPGDEQMALVSTEEDDLTDVALPSRVLDGIKAPDIVLPAHKDVNRETATRKEASPAKDKTNPGESGQVHGLEVLPSVNEAISHASEQKIARMHEQEALDTTLSNKTVSAFPETKDANVHKMQGSTDEKNEEGKGSNQLGPQWDVSDGEEDRSGLRFSFFHNRSDAPSKP